MPKSRELAEEVFKPGNLVYGGHLGDFRPYLEVGIRPAAAVGRRFSRTPDNICLALMSSRTLPDRYNRSFHYAPGGLLDSGNVGIIISRLGLMDILPGQGLAIGRLFWERGYAEQRKMYDYNRHNNTVFGFPIVQHPARETPYADEVRIYPDDPMTAAITPDTWVGIIAVAPSHLPMLSELIAGMDLERQIPVFSPRCRLLAQSLT